MIWVACIFGAWAVIPYLHAVGIFPPQGALVHQLLMVTLQAALLYGIVLWISYWLLPKTDLHPFLVTDPLKQVIYPGISVGLFIGLILYSFEHIFFQNSALSVFRPSFWVGLSASFYGGINEEVLLRLFLFTLIYFLISKFSGNRPAMLWTTTVLVALFFGLGHLPAAFQITSPTHLEIFRILLLNGIAGVAFGWLYWSKGFLAAVLAHFVCDIAIHVILI